MVLLIVDLFPFSEIFSLPESEHTRPWIYLKGVELQTKIREDFTIITEKAPTRAVFWLKAPTSAFRV